MDIAGEFPLLPLVSEIFKTCQLYSIFSRFLNKPTIKDFFEKHPPETNVSPSSI